MLIGVSSATLLESTCCQLLNSGGNDIRVAPFRRGVTNKQGGIFIKQHTICRCKVCISLGNADGFEGVGRGESILANGGYRLRDVDRADVFRPTKGQMANAFNHFGYLHLSLTLHKTLQQRVVGIVNQHAIYNIEVLICCRHTHLGKTFEVGKSSFANRF